MTAFGSRMAFANEWFSVFFNGCSWSRGSRMAGLGLFRLGFRWMSVGCECFDRSVSYRVMVEIGGGWFIFSLIR